MLMPNLAQVQNSEIIPIKVAINTIVSSASLLVILCLTDNILVSLQHTRQIPCKFPTPGCAV